MVGLRVAGAVSLVVLLFAQVGCTSLARMTLENQTGAPVVIRLKAEQTRWTDPSQDVLKTLKPKASVAFFGHRLRHGQLPISVAGCTYVYALSEDELYEMQRQGMTFPVHVALKPDLALELPRRGDKREDHRSDPKFRFPRQPIAQRCR